MPSKLWTRDFTIITLGTVVSLLGGSLTLTRPVRETATEASAEA